MDKRNLWIYVGAVLASFSLIGALVRVTHIPQANPPALPQQRPCTEFGETLVKDVPARCLSYWMTQNPGK